MKSNTINSLITLFKRLEKYSLNFSNFNLNNLQKYILKYIVLLSDKKDICQKEIENHFSLSKSTVSEILKSFEKDELITRVSSDKDQRIKIIKMTEKSTKIREEILKNIAKIENMLVADISVKEIDIFNNTLLKMNENLKKGENE
ncbi:MarR family transcriptional regulator [Streptobacillus felis]|uniref:MarR family transcriptional regulator n=1 Tax=Streptobacillus felis TaxID=1384509 RepID=A0A7Z0PFL4_9FUSO|nr:MarR family transcriptional regulator [Streptobacillus felis]NYV28124.1 MarR family transcriptional regulator [Streptobacillus felis]